MPSLYLENPFLSVNQSFRETMLNAFYRIKKYYPEAKLLAKEQLRPAKYDLRYDPGIISGIVACTYSISAG